MVELDSIEQHPTIHTKPKRTKVIIFVTFFLLLLLGAIGVTVGLLYRHFNKTKNSNNETDLKLLKAENVLPYNNSNEFKDVYPVKDDTGPKDQGSENQDKPLVVDKPDVVKDVPKEDHNVVTPKNEDKTPLVEPSPVVEVPDKPKSEDALKEQERLKQLEEERIREKNRIDAMNRKFEKEDMRKKEKPKKEQEQEPKKDKPESETKKINQKPDVVKDVPKEDHNVVTPKNEDDSFKDELDKLLKEKIDRSKELNKVIKEVKDRKNQDQPKKEKETSPKVVVVSGKEGIFERLDNFASIKGIAVVRGEFEDCIMGKCVPPRGEHVFEWELRLIAEVMDEAKKPFDLKYEFQTIVKYQEFVKKFNRYNFTKKGFKESYTNFRLTRDKIEEHNKNPDRLYNMDYTTFADTGNDMQRLSPGPAANKEKLSGLSKTSRNLRDQVIHVDWREKGIVQPVIHQGSCGSCWAVAATDVFNSFIAKNKNDKKRYSHQQLVDCVSPKYNCARGGSQFAGLKYIRDNKMCTNEEYPYVFKKNQCSAYKCEKDSGIKDIVNLGKETALDFLKENGPFVTFLNCTSDFLLYGDGIFNGSCGGRNAHSVVVVGHGFDTVKNVNYWIVKNSWGEEWGEDGYVRVLDEQTDPSDPSKHFCNFLENSHGIV